MSWTARCFEWEWNGMGLGAEGYESGDLKENLTERQEGLSSFGVFHVGVNPSEELYQKTAKSALSLSGFLVRPGNGLSPSLYQE